MGYRNYVSILKKEELNIIKNKSKKEILKILNEDYISVIELIDKFNIKESYEFGKYVEWISDIKKEAINVYKIIEDNEYDFFEISKETFKKIIEYYHIQVIEYKKEKLKHIFTIKNYCKKYENLNNDDKKILKRNIIDLERKELYEMFEWYLKNTEEIYYEKEINKNDIEKPYRLNDKTIITSYKYEYAIFELVRIYNSITKATKYIKVIYINILYIYKYTKNKKHTKVIFNFS